MTGYQQPGDTLLGHASQFYIGMLDSNNKEQRLDEKGNRTLLEVLPFLLSKCQNTTNPILCSIPQKGRVGSGI